MNDFIFLYLLINIIFLYHLKCQFIFTNQNLYLNLYAIEKENTFLFGFEKDSFGNFFILEENNEVRKFYSTNIKNGLLFTSNIYLYKGLFYNYNYFIYASYKDSDITNYKLKLILFDFEHFDDYNDEFLIQSTSNIHSFDVFYASNKTHFVFFGNKLYKYLIDFT